MKNTGLTISPVSVEIAVNAHIEQNETHIPEIVHSRKNLAKDVFISLNLLSSPAFFILKNKKKMPFFFNYLTYKPDTDILTESQQYRLCLDLLNEGYIVYCDDSSLKDQCDPRIIYEKPTEQVFEIKL